jgi:hypothetical protein
MSDDRCPPHKFKPGWQNDNLGRIFCQFCGEVRDLEPAQTEAPSEESIQSVTVTDKQA